MIKKIFYDDANFIEFNIPEQGAIGSFMSGGADSSIMCYILARIIADENLNTKILPITAEFLQRPYNLRCAHDVLEKITELTGVEFKYHPTFIIPNYDRSVSDDEKVEIMSSYTRTFGQKYNLTTIFNGLTANPPIEKVEDNIYGERQVCRDDQKWREDLKEKRGLEVPFIDVDKKVIAALYSKYSRLEDLLPLTRSCEAEMFETEYFTKDCFDIREPGKECWWCREREYGFRGMTN